MTDSNEHEQLELQDAATLEKMNQIRGTEEGPAKGQNHHRKAPTTPKRKPDPPTKNDRLPERRGGDEDLEDKQRR